MAKKTNTPKAQRAATEPVKKTVSVSQSNDLLGIMDEFFEKRLGWLIWVILGITFLISLLLFDSRVSLSGDDSFYIIRASDFLHSFKYPAFQGPLYPIVLSIFVAIFGISLVPLKLLSLISILGFMYLFFVAFKNRISSTLLIVTLVLLSINSFILYYASQTYNEAFYLFVQMGMVLVFFRYFIDNETAPSIKEDVKRHLFLALSLLLLTLTKNLGYSAVIAIAGYFTLRGQWKNLLYSLVAFGIVLLVFQGIKYVLWHETGAQFSSQGSSLLYKDYYNPQAGKEDLSGFIKRFTDNSNLYLSKHFVAYIGLRKAEPIMAVNSLTTILIYLLSITSVVLAFRKNKYLFFTGLLAGAVLFVTFIVLQAKWDQGRLIIPAVPFLVLMLFSLIYEISSSKKLRFLQIAVPVLALLVFFQSLAVSAAAIKVNQEISGQYGGLTPDWKNYLKASEWASENLAKEDVIACRKPSISFVYGNGRNFYGIMQLPNYNSEVFINNLKKEEAAYRMFRYSDFNGKQLTPELYMMLKQNMVAMVFVGDSVYFADKVTDSIRLPFDEQLKMAGLSSVPAVSTINRVITGDGKVMKVYYPDSLLNQLQNAGVTHILTANLRRNSTRKDGTIVNTVERYMAFIQEKYPEIFSKVSQIGEDNNEPATILRIEYGKYDRTVKKPEPGKK